MFEALTQRIKHIEGRLKRLEWATLSPDQRANWGTYYPADQEYCFVCQDKCTDDFDGEDLDDHYDESERLRANYEHEEV